MFKKTKLLKNSNLIVNIIVFVLSYIVLYRFFRNFDYTSFVHFFNNAFSYRDFIWFVPLMLFLSLLNWSIETFKWRNLMLVVFRMSYKNAFLSVLIGVFFSLFIPNRAGDFVGRIFSVDHEQKGKMALITLIGSFAQLIVTIFFGVMGLTYFFASYMSSIPVDLKFSYLILTLIWLSIFILLFVYFNASKYQRSINEKDSFIIRKVKNWLFIFNDITRTKLLHVLLFSVLRYFVFAIQLVLCIRFVGIEMSLMQLFFFVAVYYLLLTFIPTIVYSEIGVRGALSIYLFGILLYLTSSPEFDYEIAVSFATVIIWIANIVLPAIVGSFYTRKIKFFKP